MIADEEGVRLERSADRADSSAANPCRRGKEARRPTRLAEYQLAADVERNACGEQQEKGSDSRSRNQHGSAVTGGFV